MDLSLGRSKTLIKLIIEKRRIIFVKMKEIKRIKMDGEII